jgi:hypothetical protein
VLSVSLILFPFPLCFLFSSSLLLCPLLSSLFVFSSVIFTFCPILSSQLPCFSLLYFILASAFPEFLQLLYCSHPSRPYVSVHDSRQSFVYLCLPFHMECNTYYNSYNRTRICFGAC